MARDAVCNSWKNPRAVTYRQHKGISDSLGLAVTIQRMVFGNLDNDSAAGIAYTRHLFTDVPGPIGEVIFRAQGNELASGLRTPEPLEKLNINLPNSYEELTRMCTRLEALFGAAQEFEFTIESGRLFVLQSREASEST